MSARDELSELWCSQPVPAAVSREELVMLVQKRTRQFDRVIRRRNALECFAALAVALIFGAMAAHAPDALQRAGLLIVAASGLWIIFFLARYGKATEAADSSQDLGAYRRALVERFDHQIWLLKSVKYWYLLPPWLGLLLWHAGVLLRESHARPLGWYDFIAPVIYTGCYAFVWWLNEGYGVARLRTERARVMAMLGTADPAGAAGAPHEGM